MEKISDFQIKDVINIADGRRLGFINDIEINLEAGRIEAIVVAGGNRVLGFFNRGDEIVIPWRNILKIGEDVILVRHDKSSNYELIDRQDGVL